MRESLLRIEKASGKPFNYARFELLEKSSDAAWPVGIPLHFHPDKVIWPAHWEDAPEHVSSSFARSAEAPVMADAKLLQRRSTWPSSFERFVARLRAHRSL